MDNIDRAVISILFLVLFGWCLFNSILINSHATQIRLLKESQTVNVSPDLTIVGDVMERNSDFQDEVISDLEQIKESLKSKK